MAGTKRDIEPVPGPFPEVARLVRAAIGVMSTRVAARRTQNRVSHDTFARLLNGDRATPSTLDAVARAFAIPVDDLRRAAGHLTVEEEEGMAPKPRLRPVAAPDVPSNFATARTDDPLSRFGPDVDMSIFRLIPMGPGYVSAGILRTPELMEGDAPLGNAIPEGFRAIRVQGDCMEPDYKNGDVLLISQYIEARSGDDVIALVDMSTLGLKKFRRSREGVAYLEAANGDTIAADRFQIIGVVKGLVRLR